MTSSTWRAAAAAVILSSATAACAPERTLAPGVAPGAPGADPFWTTGRKTGLGTSYEAYLNGAHDDAASTGPVSRVWFTLADGMITEVSQGLIHERQLKSVRFAVAGEGFVDFEDRGMVHTQSFMSTDADGRPLAPAYVIESRDLEGRYTLTKTILTDPDRQSLVIKARLEGERGLRLHLIVDPNLNNSALNDTAEAVEDALYAEDEDRHVAVLSAGGFAQESVGFGGVSDGLADLSGNNALDWEFVSTGDIPGDVVLTARFPRKGRGALQREIAIGFGQSRIEAETTAQASLDAGFDAISARFVGGQGDGIVGWADYIGSLTGLDEAIEVSRDGGALAQSSALLLKALEDKTHSGASVETLAIPWGMSVPAGASSPAPATTSARTLRRSMMAFLALGDEQSALAAFRFARRMQVSEDRSADMTVAGWFPSDAMVSGVVLDSAVQLDQTAAPVLMGWTLWREGVLSDGEIAAWYERMLRPAAQFLAETSRAGLRGSDPIEIYPPATEQDRWGGQGGYSPSTTASVVSALIAASEIALSAGFADDATLYRDMASAYSARIEARLFTTNGQLSGGGADGRYFLRASINETPDDRSLLNDENGRVGLAEDQVVSPDVLELVRLGVRSSTSSGVIETLPELDSPDLPEDVRIFVPVPHGNGRPYPAWRRFGGDGYGEDAGAGGAFPPEGSPTHRGRAWPVLTGERGHYELALALADGDLNDIEYARLRLDHVGAMEAFAGEHLLIPQQIWDGVGANPRGYAIGDPTGAATPSAWAHAEYLSLLRSLADGRVWSGAPSAAERLDPE